ncbi:hypothetical protein CLV58_13641 [Spirosoma oryzae]|uniref:Uncharacterized protein n=1 Tax=Spirosoma oryzae TaxID=1469603 RepID=A0A2T0RXI8_9BACT|nr:hypothetical protein [Spirosoma oryzae]PRY25906.1 hypothetical protein CLV58_13641 [Spirosoma oryzae]
MQFFIPLATSPQQAERIHYRIVSRLTALGYALTDHRIARVIYRRDGRIISDAVGSRCDNGEIVLAIFKYDVGYAICTYSHGAVGGSPVTVGYGLVESANVFDELDSNAQGPQ